MTLIKENPQAIFTQLEAARAELKALQKDLPQFHGLLTSNEQEAQKLRTERADINDQAQARGRVTVAKELLEQHQSDIATARAEVQRLEALAAREQTLQEMVEHAKEATRQRQALESALEAANTAFLKHIEKVDGAWIGMSQARNGFLDASGRITPAFNFLNYPTAWSNERIEAERTAGHAVLEELKTRGVDLNDVLTSIADDRRSSEFDLHHSREVKQPQPFAWMIHQARQVFKAHKYGSSHAVRMPVK